MKHQTPNDRHTRQALDAIADLLLTVPVEQQPLPPSEGPDAAPARRLRLSAPALDEPADATPPIIEALLLGHLPGYANPWISQYAQHVAAHRGPAALLRFDATHVELEIFGDEKTDWRPPVAPGPGGSATRLQQILDELAPQVGTWILALGSPAETAVRSRLAMIDRWVVLSGADDAAVVGAYRLLKGLIDSDPEAIPPAAAPRIVGLMVMGCQEGQARAVLDRISAASAEFLRTPIELAGFRAKMLPIRRFYLGRFEAESSALLWAQLQGYFDELRPGSTHPPIADQAVLPPLSPTQITAEELAALTGPFDAEQPDTNFTPDFVRFPASNDTEADDYAPPPELAPPAQSASAGRATDRPRKSTPPAASAPSSHPSNSIASSLQSAPQERGSGIDLANLAAAVPGLTALRAKCPRQPKVQLAADAQGTCHLLLAAQGEPVDAAVKKLSEARSWAVEHRQLLAMTAPEILIASEADPVPHLFTDQPRQAADLAFSGPATSRPLRLHLLKAFNVAGSSIWVHEELT